jgi:hypothetical protein
MSRGGGVAGSSGVKGRRSGWAGLAGQHEERGGDEIGRHKPKEKHISVREPTARGPDRLVREAVAYREERASAGELGRLGQIPGED